MIAVDTSALMAIILDEEHGEACSATVAEALIVSHHRRVAPEMQRLLEGLGFDVVPVTSTTPRRIADIYRRWGKGSHQAALNFGDCFAYDIAKTNACTLLFVGDDFQKTDILSAL